MRALPIILADTSALARLNDMEFCGDQMAASNKGNRFSAEAALNALCIKDKRTIIMPGSVLTELFPTITGRLTIAHDEDGKPAFPIHSSHTMFELPESLALYQYFSGLAQQPGKLRCYNSVQEMIAAGEIDHPKGGIVFVSMGEIRSPDGHSFSKQKHTRLLKTPEIKEVIQPATSDIIPTSLHEAVAAVPATVQDAASAPVQPAPKHIKTNQPLLPKPKVAPVTYVMEPKEAKPERPARYKDHGDKDIVTLAYTIREHLQQQDKMGKMMVLSNDIGLFKRLRAPENNGFKRDILVTTPATSLLNAMNQRHLLDKDIVEHAQSTLPVLAKQDDAWRTRFERMSRPEGMQQDFYEAREAALWLDATDPFKSGYSRDK